jgi:hypothetical protein
MSTKKFVIDIHTFFFYFMYGYHFIGQLVVDIFCPFTILTYSIEPTSRAHMIVAMGSYKQWLADKI